MYSRVPTKIKYSIREIYFHTWCYKFDFTQGGSIYDFCIDSDLIVIKFGECELAIRVMSSNVSDVSQGSQTTRIKMCDVEILYQTLIRSKFKWIATPGVFCCLSAKN